MKMSRLFSRTLREAPGKGGSPGLNLLVRAGYVRRTAAGIYSLLPLGRRVQDRIQVILKAELEALGAEELRLPHTVPAELLQESGRWWELGEQLARYTDRSGREMGLPPGREEAAVDVIRDQINSYRQLPVLVCHIGAGWRDVAGDREDAIGARESVAAELFSFEPDEEGLQKSFVDLQGALEGVFTRCGLPVQPVTAPGNTTAERNGRKYLYLHPEGRETAVLCPACGYGADSRAAALHKRLFPEEPERIEMVQTPATSTIAALTELLDIPARKTAKVVFSMGCFVDPQDCTKCYEKLVTAVIRGDLEVEQQKLQRACEARSLRPASEEEITACGMSPGYGSPIGAWNTVVIVDDSAAGSNNLAAGANRPDYHFLNTNFARDYLGSVADIAAAREGDACPECGEPLTLKSGIQLGHLSLPGTRYTAAMGAYYQDKQGSSRPIQMGAGTVDFDRLLGALAEEHHDRQGLCLPAAAAPFQVHIVDLLSDPAEADALCAELEAAGLTVLLDDHEESAGVKFNDADLLGMPLRITVGNKSLREGQVEFRRRADGESWRVARSEAAETARSALFSSDQGG